MLAFIPAIQPCTQSSRQNYKKKEIKLTQTSGKEVIKLFLFAEDMSLYKENPEEFTRKILELKK